MSKQGVTKKCKVENGGDIQPIWFLQYTLDDLTHQIEYSLEIEIDTLAPIQQIRQILQRKLRLKRDEQLYLFVNAEDIPLNFTAPFDHQPLGHLVVSRNSLRTINYAIAVHPDDTASSHEISKTFRSSPKLVRLMRWLGNATLIYGGSAAITGLHLASGCYTQATGIVPDQSIQPLDLRISPDHCLTAVLLSDSLSIFHGLPSSSSKISVISPCVRNLAMGPGGLVVVLTRAMTEFVPTVTVYQTADRTADDASPETAYFGDAFELQGEVEKKATENGKGKQKRLKLVARGQFVVPLDFRPKGLPEDISLSHDGAFLLVLRHSLFLEERPHQLLIYTVGDASPYQLVHSIEIPGPERGAFFRLFVLRTKTVLLEMNIGHRFTLHTYRNADLFAGKLQPLFPKWGSNFISIPAFSEHLVCYQKHHTVILASLGGQKLQKIVVREQVPYPRFALSPDESKFAVIVGSQSTKIYNTIWSQQSQVILTLLCARVYSSSSVLHHLPLDVFKAILKHVFSFPLL